MTIIEDIINDVNEISKVDVMKESINQRLKNSLKLYLEELDNSYEEVLTKEYGSIIRSIVKKYDNYSNDYKKLMEEGVSDD